MRTIRKTILCILLSGFSGGTQLGSSANDASPVQRVQPEVLSFPLGERQLFVDDFVISEIQNLRQTLHQPDKKGAVVIPDRWEVALQTRCAPAWDAERGVYKLWLITSTKSPDDSGTTYAESPDGIHWTKPNLGQVEVQGSLENNFVVLDPKMKWPENAIENVVYDPVDIDPARRFKGFLGCYGREPIFSPDGIHWTRPGLPKIPSQDESNLSYDRSSGTFIATLKQSGPFGRSHALSTSKNFVDWTTPELVFCADEEDQVRARQNIESRLSNPDLVPPAHSDPADYKADIYNFPIFRYEGMYLALPAVYHTTSLMPGDDDGFHLIQLASSRDLRNWVRVGNRQTFLGPSPSGAGAFDTMQILPPSAPILRGEELWFYYTGIKYRSLPAEHDAIWGAICLATLRRDGFVSLDADSTPGVLTTKPFVATGGQVHVNIDARPTGKLVVEILNEQGALVAESETITGDMPQKKVESKGEELPAIAGRTIRLRFTLQNASLYSFWLSE